MINDMAKNDNQENIVRPKFEHRKYNFQRVRVINLGKCQIFLATKQKNIKNAAKLS